MVGPEIDGGSLPPVFSLECGGGASLGFQLVRGDYRAYTRQTKQVASTSVSSSCSSALCSTPSRTWWQPSTAASSSTPAGTPAWTPCSGGPGRPWSSLSTTSRCSHHLDKRYKIHAFMLLHPPQDCQLNLEKVRKNTKRAVTEILPPTENPFCSR